MQRTILNIDQGAWFNLAQFVVPKGQVCIIRELSFSCTDPNGLTENDLLQFNYQVLVNNTAQKGMDQFGINAYAGQSLKCFILADQNSDVKVQAQNPGFSIMTDVNFTCFIYGQLLLRTNYPLPFQPCNVE